VARVATERGQPRWVLAGMIVFEGIAVGVGLLLVFSHLIERIHAPPGVLLGIAAGLAVFGDRLGTDPLVVGLRLADSPSSSWEQH
jgi:hypothetical protein